MSHGNNDIDNVNVASGTNNNDIDNVFSKSKSVEMIAERALGKLGMKPESKPFLCKAAYRLSEARFWGNVEQALKGKNPAGLFIWLCKRDGV